MKSPPFQAILRDRRFLKNAFSVRSFPFEKTLLLKGYQQSSGLIHDSYNKH
ncbi:hypothetical protein EVA_03703 [gut metagenome]|uniref:Uncharacterized protein n=1 Tax=gut metagenome TaxID=749906 RepID=J9GLA3_9ZZZZ